VYRIWARGLQDFRGHSIATADHIWEARDIIKERAKDSEDGVLFYTGVVGPMGTGHLEAYVVENGEATKTTYKPAPAELMSKPLQEKHAEARRKSDVLEDLSKRHYYTDSGAYMGGVGVVMGQLRRQHLKKLMTAGKTRQQALEQIYKMADTQLSKLSMAKKRWPRVFNLMWQLYGERLLEDRMEYDKEDLAAAYPHLDTDEIAELYRQLQKEKTRT